MKDIVLINPNYTGKETKIFKYHLTVQRYPPLGLAYLAGSLEKAGFYVSIIDAVVLQLTPNEALKILKKEKPKFVGIYVVSFSLPVVYQLIKKIKAKIKCKVVVGGPHITHRPQAVFKLGADYGIRGEGEYAIVDLLKGVNKRKISGLVYKERGKIKINKPAMIKDLDVLPLPARHLLPNDKYYSPLWEGKTTTMVTSRGCVFKCIFCGLPTERIYRARSVDSIIKEIKYLADSGFKYIEMQDDFFTFDKKRIKKFCQYLIKAKLHIRWGCETRADFVNQKLLMLMRKAGCLNVNFGVEAGSEYIRNKIVRKNLSDKVIKKAIRAAKEAKLVTIAYFIFGHPTETIADMEKTFAFAQELNPKYAEFHLPIPIPGARLFDVALKEGKLQENVWDEVIFGKSIPFYTPDNIKLEEMLKLQKRAYTEFYFSLPKLMTYLINVRSLRDLWLKLKAGFIILKNRSLQ